MQPMDTKEASTGTIVADAVLEHLLDDGSVYETIPHFVLEWQYGLNVLRVHRAFVQPRSDGPTVDDSDVFPRLVVMPAA